MGMTDTLLPFSVMVAGWLLCLGGLAVAAVRADWPQLFVEKALQHTLFGSTVGLAMLWQMRAGLNPGLTVHLLGMTTVTLMLGWSLAVLAGSLALVAMVLLGREPLGAFGINDLVTVIIPALVTQGIMLWERQRFRLFFAYIFVCGFFGAAIAVVAGGVFMVVLLWVFGVYDWDLLVRDYLRYLPLIAMPEALINGMTVTGIMVYFPKRLLTLDESRYL